MRLLPTACLIAACLIGASLPGVALADSPPDELVEIRNGAVPQLRADRAYLLFRIPRPRGANSIEPLLMRVPTADEIARYESAREEAYARALPGLQREFERELEREQRRRQRGQGGDDPPPQPPSLETFQFAWDQAANLQDVDFSDTFSRASDENTYLVEALPGDYVLYGMTPSMGLPRLMVCFCLGTVGFHAPAGQITDLGYIIGDIARERSVIPELADETGYGPSSDVGLGVLLAGTVRPARPGSSMPPELAGARVVAGEYHAVGRFLTPNTMGINRLVPVPGVLEYDRGRVIDARTGNAVPDNM
ncbi:hypothetical protein [Aurantiacibacter zhengii]|uniref:Uncharacterized protein n=1 Tax=Aurantiacibacter zhengii TaxID=2307003 RepID=A0A418NUR7_9SPHN|nr:hypothetical protein [Aurantiacibacter zhengii]RIV87907.1 hypothetical protein D2V07_06215 [Aurantiacibacter zhengii]